MSDKSRFSNPSKQRERELRQGQTLAEQHAWHVLRNRRAIGFKFRRQLPIGDFIVDFYCDELKLVIEIDGDIHAEPHQAEYDAARTAGLQERGYHIIRFSNDDVHNRLDGVLESIREACDRFSSPSL